VTMRKLILASGSPRRIELLKEEGFEFDIIKSNYLEDMTLPLPPKELAKKLSLGKVKDVAQYVFENAVILGADTFVVFKGKVLGKPTSQEHAREMLAQLGGHTHSVVTGFTLLDTKTKDIYQDAIESEIAFREISLKEIEVYVATGEPMDKAGSYAIQGGAKDFVEHVTGSLTNIIGLPMDEVVRALDGFGVMKNRS
jgi:septum formation protein